MPLREQDNLPYRTPATAAPAPVTTSKDEDNYNTLKMVGTIFSEAIEGLYKEFNAFDVLSKGTTVAVRDEMMRKIAGNQTAYDILAPLLERVNSAMQIVDDKYKQR